MVILHGIFMIILGASRLNLHFCHLLNGLCMVLGPRIAYTLVSCFLEENA
jgi:hypothetical protein